MARRRFYVPTQFISGQTAALPPEQAHHLRDVLRLGVGDMVEIFDGAGSEYAGTIEACGREVRVGKLTRLEPARDPVRRVVLAPALIKHDRFEWMLEKATELGVSEFVPLMTRYCGLRIPENRLEARLERWRRIVTGASRQSGGRHVPVVRNPVGFGAFLAGCGTVPLARYLLNEDSRQLLAPAPSQGAGVLLCIGPEGGWDSAEVADAVAAGFADFSLGQSILRSETAAIAAAAMFLIRTSGWMANPNE